MDHIFKCENCGNEFSAEEVLQKDARCRCGETIIAFSINAAARIAELRKELMALREAHHIVNNAHAADQIRTSELRQQLAIEIEQVRNSIAVAARKNAVEVVYTLSIRASELGEQVAAMQRIIDDYKAQVVADQATTEEA